VIRDFEAELEKVREDIGDLYEELYNHKTTRGRFKIIEREIEYLENEKTDIMLARREIEDKKRIFGIK